MKEITFTCEIVTPMFIYGADQNTPELRPPAIKSMIRIWWRILYQDLLLPEPIIIQKMLNQESLIFGGKTKEMIDGKEKEVSYKGSVNIHLIENKTDTENNPRPFNKNIKSGLTYLFYTINRPETSFGKGNELCKKYLKDKGTFKIKLTSKDKDKTKLEQAAISFLYLSLFGALGSRSRRGAGNFRILEIENTENINLPNLDLKKFTSKDLLEPKLKEFTLLNKFVKHIFVFDNSRTWDTALNTIGEYFRDYRSQNTAPNKIVSDVYNTPKFGFPVIHGIRIGNKTTFIAKNARGDKLERRASQLIFKVIKTDNGIYFPIIIWFEGDFLPDGFEIMEKNEYKQLNPQPNKDIIQEFIDNKITPLINSGNAVEVIL